MKVLKWILYGLLGIVVLAASAVAVILMTRPAKNAYPNEKLAFENKLVIPPLMEGHIENGERVFDLALEKGTTEFSAGRKTNTAGFNGSYLGPTLRASTNDKVRVNVTNDLGEASSVHWHGMHLPAAMDGGPHQIIENGEMWHPNWTVTNEASTLWYHPHLMGNTGAQVYKGLAGVFILDDANSKSLDLPHDYGVDDIPLVVQDRLFDANGQFVYEGHAPGSDLPKPSGMLGDTILVNGTLAPYADVPQTLVRLRLVNGSNGRRYNFGFSGDHPFYVIATDGGLLEAPVQSTRILLASGERAEILVDLSDVTAPLTLMSYQVTGPSNALIAFISGFFGQDDTGQQFKILELRPQAGSFAKREIPQKLNTIVRPDESAAIKRTVKLDSRTLNNKVMDNTRADFVVKQGDTEIWEISNQSPFDHPFHIHAVQFLVLSRDGAEPPAVERGWKDTVLVKASEKVRVIMKFDVPADPTLPYMFHCHILEHEDMGMMAQFVVVNDLSDEVKIKSPLLDPTDGMQMDH